MRLIYFFLSLCIVAWSQPAKIGWLGAVSAIFGFAFFFHSLSSSFSKWQRFFAGTIWFASIEFIQLSWMTSIEFHGFYILLVYFLVALGLGCQFGLLTIFIPAHGKMISKKILFCASLWTFMEWLRLCISCGFSWNPIGLSLTHFIVSLQFSSLFGVLGLSFWVMLTNLVSLNALRSTVSIKYISSWVMIIAAPYLFGLCQLNYYQREQRSEKSIVDIALVQTDLLPSEKNPHRDRMDDFIAPLEQWKRIIISLKEKQVFCWDMIVLPEAAVPLSSNVCNYSYDQTRKLLVTTLGPEVEKKFPPLCFPYAEQKEFINQKVLCVSNLFWCQTLANFYDAEIIVGLDHYDRKENKNFNSIFYLTPNHFLFERYDKQILLPLAEYLPFDFLQTLTKKYGICEFFSHGQEAKVFGKKIPFSPSICYEETFSEMMRIGRLKGAKLFVNATNDNYYPDSSLHAQHFFHARLRAVENGIPLIRACNSGVTAIVDCFGRFLAKFESEDKERKHDGVLNYHLTCFHFSTLFSFWGDAGIIGLCLIFILYPLRMKNKFFN